MRENSVNRSQKRAGGNAAPELKKCAMREFAAVSEYIYYSLILEGEYPELSRVFERAALDAVERFRKICVLIVSLGGNPALNMQIRQSRDAMMCREALSSERVEKILRSAKQSEQRGMAAIERAVALTENAELKRKAELLAGDKKELAITFERLLSS